MSNVTHRRIHFSAVGFIYLVTDQQTTRGSGLTVDNERKILKMPLFQQAVDISVEEVSKVVSDHWNIELEKIIKASQNHTFLAKRRTTKLTTVFEKSDSTIDSDDGDENVVVRVTPDPEHKHLSRIENEIRFVRFIREQEEVQYVCGPIPSIHGEYMVAHGDLIIAVSEWAKGRPVEFMNFSSWLTNREFVYAWGRWLAIFHQASRKFSQQYPEIASNIQCWNEIHEGILRNAPIHPDDLIAMENKDPGHYGIVHGDVNTSNFFFIDQEQKLSVFDWDQTQQGWYLWDVAQSEFSVHMLAGAGSLIDGSPVLEANPVEYEDWLIAGYESVTGKGSVDRQRLQRMVELRMYFYETFCRTAKAEGNLPPDMEYFINYIIRWFDRRAELKERSMDQA
jgi:Ser/Thr protein kinase RdoA (MazF antagonist)